MQNLSKFTIVLLLCIFGVTGWAQTKPSATAAKKAAPPQPAKVQKPAPPPAPPQDATTLPSGLTIAITHHGTGAPTKAGDIVLVHYTGLLTSGVKFDSSR
ncbi:MAG TPA: hypothetical protein VEW69_09905, partial [Alphaproteobacteria bacterium]|nr:hypothetical protein [Alphaproteobacteria bacterium]